MSNLADKYNWKCPKCGSNLSTVMFGNNFEQVVCAQLCGFGDTRGALSTTTPATHTNTLLKPENSCHTTREGGRQEGVDGPVTIKLQNCMMCMHLIVEDGLPDVCAVNQKHLEVDVVHDYPPQWCPLRAEEE